jgi:hypothetical protein
VGRGDAVGWPGRITDRLRFERGARAAYPRLRGGPAKRTASGGFRYVVTIDVPFYEPRTATIAFPPRSRTAVVLADGPPQSPHRYDHGGLCMWHPEDPPSQRWRFDDGLLDLLDTITAHLFREAWWREHHEWLGPEAGHDSDIDEPEEVA